MKKKRLFRLVISVILTLCLIFSIGIISYAADTGTEAMPLPEAYCMRDEYVVLAQNQDNHGYCWNFAATMAASTTLMKAIGEYYDFS